MLFDDADSTLFISVSDYLANERKQKLSHLNNEKILTILKYIQDSFEILQYYICFSNILFIAFSFYILLSIKKQTQSSVIYAEPVKIAEPV